MRIEEEFRDTKNIVLGVGGLSLSRSQGQQRLHALLLIGHRLRHIYQRFAETVHLCLRLAGDHVLVGLNPEYALLQPVLQIVIGEIPDSDRNYQGMNLIFEHPAGAGVVVLAIGMPPTFAD